MIYRHSTPPAVWGGVATVAATEAKALAPRFLVDKNACDAKSEHRCRLNGLSFGS